MSSSPLESILSELLLSPIDVETDVPGARFFLRIRGIDRPHGFRVDVQRRFSWIDASLSFDRLSSHIRHQLAHALSANNVQFAASLAALSYKGVNYREVPVPALPAERAASFTAFSSRVSLDAQPSVWEAERLSSLSILLPIVQLLDPHFQDDGSQDDDENVEDSYDEEGQVTYRWSRRYERSAANRALAIELHGRTCLVCRINLNEYYGPLASGYVEIHHLIPVSSMDGPATVDPRTDLVPLCANCHRMAHRKWPPYTPTELRASISHQNPSTAG